MNLCFGKEEYRQVVHIFLGCILVFLIEIGFVSGVGKIIYLNFVPVKKEAFVLFIVFLIGLFLSFLCKYMRVPVLDFFLKYLERKSVRKSAPGKGAIYGAFGSFLVLSLFDLRVAKASILVLAFGDSVSNLVGVNFGVSENPLDREKSLEGSFSGFLVASLVASAYFPWMISAVASFFAMASECLIGFVNDNVTIPLVAGLFFSFLG